MKTDAAVRTGLHPVDRPTTERRGLVVRPYAGPADLPDLVRIQNAAWAADGVRETVSVADLRAWLAHPSEQFDPGRDVAVVELGRRPVAYTQQDWIDATDGVREYRSRCWIEPGARRRGIGTMLLERSEARRRSLARTHDTDRARCFGIGTAEGGDGGIALARRFGYEPVRWFTEMERPLPEPLPEIPALGDGLEVRPVSPDDARRVWEADLDAFQDHWGGWDSSEAGYRRWIESPDFQPELMVVAWDGAEIAGAVLNAIYTDENEALGVARGWLESVFTRRPWRRRGLARALIVRSLHLLRSRGMETAALHVDSDNPTGALGLYEAAGFVPASRSTAWRKPMEFDR